MLSGLLRCGHCGRKLTVRYSGQGRSARYVCVGAMINHGQSNSCIAFGAIRVDRGVSQSILETLQPMGLDAAMAATQRLSHEADAAFKQRELALAQAKFEAERARRQFDAVEPENRLVATELEHRWNDALQIVHQREEGLQVAKDAASSAPCTAEQRQLLSSLADDLPAVWEHPAADIEIKKRIARVLIKEIVVSLLDERIRLVLHWRGGDHSELEVAKNRPGINRWITDVETAQIIEGLARHLPDSKIAALLNRAGRRTGRGLTWTRNRVCCFRNDRKIAVFVEGERQARNELTLAEAADVLRVSTMTVRRLIKRDILAATQVCFGAPWVIRKQDLDVPAVSDALRDGQLTANHKQQPLNFQ